MIKSQGMKNEKFTNEKLEALSKVEILFGAKAAYRNATTLFESANKLSLVGTYGLSNSLLILSVEECIKCMILMTGYFGTKVDFDIAPFFAVHETKHIEAAKIQPFANNFSHFSELMIDVFRKRKSTFSMVINLGVSMLFSSINFGNEDPGRFKKWWDSANNSKNNGLYVGHKNSKWMVPTDISKEAFDETLAMASPFIKSLQLITEIRDEDYKLFHTDGH